MFDWFTAPVAEGYNALKDLIIWSLVIYGAFQMATIGGVIARTYYTLKIIRQVSALLSQLVTDIKSLKEVAAPRKEE